jgi:hypothetical protein
MHCTPYVNFCASALIEQNDVWSGAENCYASRPDHRPGRALCNLWA